MDLQAQLPPVDRGLKRFWWVATVVGVLLVAGMFTARPGYRWIKAQRARQLVDEAVPLVTGGQWDQVRPKLEVAVKLAPFEPRVRWLLARYYSAGGAAQALDIWSTVPAGNLTREDRLAWTSLALRHSRLDVAARLTTGLLAEFPDEPAVLQLAMQTADRHGDSAQSLGYAERWRAKAPDSPEARWHVGQRLLRAREPGGRAEGRRLLLGLVQEAGPFQLPAAGLLADDPGLSPTERQELLGLLRERRVPPLILAAAEFHLGPDQQAGAVARVVAAAQVETNAPALTAQIDWLVQHGAAARVTGILTREKVAAQPRLRSARVQALLENGLTAEAREELALLDAPTDALHRLCFEAWLAHDSGREADADSHLMAAVAQAKESAGALRFVAEHALRLGRVKPAIEAYQKLLHDPAGAVDAARSLSALAVQADDLEVLLGAMEELRDRLPGDPTVGTLRLYLRFLLGRGTRQDLDWAVDQTRAPGANALLLAGRALGRWRLGEAAEGLDEVEALAPELRAGEIRLQLVHAILLAANQQREASRQITRAIPQERLHRDERRILTSAVP